MLLLKKNLNYIPISRHKDLLPLKFPECIHLSDNCRCSLLRVKDCLGTDCSFCVTVNEIEQSQEDWHSYMNSLSDEKQKKIAKSYYGGKMPWKEHN